MSRRTNEPSARAIRAGAVRFLVPALLCACASQARSVSSEVRSLVDHGQYEEAVRRSADAAAAHPDDPALQKLHRDATVAYLLEQGRRLTFQDRDEEAVVPMRRALELDPDSAEAASWLDKTNRKLARKNLDEALELHAKDEIPEALEHYQRALDAMPGDKDALTGRDICLRILDYRAGLGHGYFDEGVRALSEYWLEQARSRFSYSHKYQPEDERTQDRKGQVEKLLASQRMSAGQDFEANGNFGAARNEYRIALLLDPTDEEARASIERVQRELEVQTLLSRAGMNVVRGSFDEATKLVEEASKLTQAQQDEVEGQLARIREARLARDYRDALVLEHDFRYEEAVEKYAELLEKAQFYKDVIARKDTLEEYMKLAAELYDKAQAEPDKDKKLAYLHQIRVFWPEYKDIRAQITELEKSQAP